jgi:hypothetical protein
VQAEVSGIFLSAFFMVVGNLAAEIKNNKDTSWLHNKVQGIGRNLAVTYFNSDAFLGDIRQYIFDQGT